MTLFVYGTLMLPEIRVALLGKTVSYKSATLLGYQSYTIYNGNHESEYPVLKPVENSILKGIILESLTQHDFDILSYYEGDEYYLQEINVTVNDEIINTKIYMAANAIKYGSKWNLKSFTQNNLKHYVDKEIPGMLEEINRQIK